MIKYQHALALNPYFGDATALMGTFPPTGLEYIAASMQGLVDKVTLLDLRYERAYQDPKLLSAFIRNEIDSGGPTDLDRKPGALSDGSLLGSCQAASR